MSQDDVFRGFLSEMGDRLDDFEQALARLEREFSLDTVNELFRAIHTIKGGAGFFDLGNITRISHQMEDLLSRIRAGDAAFDPAMVPVFYQATDSLRQMHEAPDQGRSLNLEALFEALRFKPGAATGAPSSPTTSAPATARVPHTDAHTAGPLPAAAAPATPTPVPAAAPAAPPAAATPVALTRPAPTTPALRSPAAPAAPGTAAPAAAAASTRHEFVRVKVDLLDRLMELTGEIVVARNQLLRQFSDHADSIALSSMAHMISDLQQAVLQTRMQPVGGTFTKFSRIVRDLSRQLDKPIELVIRGDETELDRSIIEALSDPLTHLIRNCADHGVEHSEERVANGKVATATIRLEARNEGGQVAITVEDDGKGIDTVRVRAKAQAQGLITAAQASAMSDNEAANLIFHPGLSTAEQVTDLSGRGVGMDVVKATIERLGGTIELETRLGLGTRVSIYLPTTLTIMSSLIVRIGQARFAVPHADLSEVISVREGDEVQIERIRDRDVYRLRGHLIAVISLQQIIGEPQSLAQSAGSNRQFMVLKSGATTFGLFIDEVDHTEEIVIKPLPQILKKLSYYAGSSILGDSDVAMVLSANGICQSLNLHLYDLEAGRLASRSMNELQLVDLQEKQDLLVFRYGPEAQFAVPLSLVSKVEIIDQVAIQRIGQRQFVQLEGRNILLVFLHEYLQLPALAPDKLYVFTTRIKNFEVAVVASSIEESIHTRLNLDSPPMNESIVLGVTTLHERLTFVLDLFSLAEKVNPEVFKSKAFSKPPTRNRLLVVDDTPFFRNLEKKYFESIGFEVSLAFNGQEALDMLLEKPRRFDLVVTDIVMPVMDGFGLLKNIRSHPELNHIPVIALTSFVQEDSQQRARDAGFAGYALKTNKETILEAVAHFMSEI